MVYELSLFADFAVYGSLACVAAFSFAVFFSLFSILCFTETRFMYQLFYPQTTPFSSRCSPDKFNKFLDQQVYSTLDV